MGLISRVSSRTYRFFYELFVFYIFLYFTTVYIMIRLSTSHRVRWHKLNSERASKIVDSFLPTKKLKVESENPKTNALHEKFSNIKNKTKTENASSDHMFRFFNDPS